MTSNELTSQARTHDRALRFAGALLETVVRLAVVAVVLSAVAIRITIAFAIGAVRLHAEPSLRLAAVYLAFVPMLLVWHGAFAAVLSAGA